MGKGLPLSNNRKFPSSHWQRLTKTKMIQPLRFKRRCTVLQNNYLKIRLGWGWIWDQTLDAHTITRKVFLWLLCFPQWCTQRVCAVIREDLTVQQADEEYLNKPGSWSQMPPLWSCMQRNDCCEWQQCSGRDSVNKTGVLPCGNLHCGWKLCASGMHLSQIQGCLGWLTLGEFEKATRLPRTFKGKRGLRCWDLLGCCHLRS